MLENLEAVWPEGFETAPEPTPEPSPTSGAFNVTPYAPTTAELSRQLLPTVRKAYGLAQHGAVYAAQTEFIQVLRRIAEAKDAAEGVDTHSQSLAAGLRALDEADDFAPQGVQLEADLNVAVIIAAHRTPVLLDKNSTRRPAEAIAHYHQFARQQLAQAVAGEQAGSMALYGLGKVQNRLAYDADGELRHERKALTMFLAALDAGPGNHLAANEIGVLLTRGGQPAEASAMFRRAIDVAPTSTSYHNLAVVERTLGYHEQAAANEQYARQLAQRDRAAGAASRAKGVQWVAPQELSRVAQPLPIESDQNRMTRAPQRLPQPPATGPVQTAAKWPQKLVPGVFRR
jgi:tetratricopeptide (TPR) repeat protein